MNLTDRIKKNKAKIRAEKQDFFREMNKYGDSFDLPKPTHLTISPDVNLGRILLPNLQHYIERWYCWNESQSISESSMRQMLPASYRSLFYEVMGVLNCLVDDSMYFLYEGASTRIIEDLDQLTKNYPLNRKAQ